ncbi:DUF4365 domain-containing protein [Streptomyces sp. C10]|uniref:DUF4365 domain-containing protein n=1 Tax=Streptomyces sp. C10 TaxID=531941 RepID=UPI003980E78F
MTSIRPSRRIERAGVNSLRALLEEHDHIVHEIDGGSDYGEDLIVHLVQDGRRTGHVVAVQVKSGKKYKRARGYAVPVDDHYGDWRESRIPVLGVVFDLDIAKLFWVNLTEALWKAEKPPAWVQVPVGAVLSSDTIHEWSSAVGTYMDRAGIHPFRMQGSDRVVPIGVWNIEREHFLASAENAGISLAVLGEQALSELLNGTFRPQFNKVLDFRFDPAVGQRNINLRLDADRVARAKELVRQPAFIEELGWKPSGVALLLRLYMHERFPMSEG